MSTSEPAREQVGAELRRLRDDADIRAVEAAQRISTSRATLYRIELGQSPIEPTRAAQLARFYGADTDTVNWIADLAAAAEEAGPMGWWHEYGGAPSAWFEKYLAAEQTAACIGMWYQTTIPGLLQTAEYARATIHHADPAAVQREVDIRMRRQRILDGGGALNVSVLLGEAALRRVVGSRDVQRSQLLRLAALSSLDHVHIGVVPFTAPAHPGMAGGPVVLLGHDLVYLESHLGATYLRDPQSVKEHLDLLAEVGAACLPESDTAEFLVQVARQL